MAATTIRLFNDLFKAIEAGTTKKLKQTIKSLQPFLESLDANATAVLENEKNPLKDTNLIILCCKFGQLNVLDYFLSNGKLFIDSLYNGRIANVLSPVDKDGEGHNAFYYAIRSNNAEIVQLLLTKWLPSFIESVARKDVLLSKAYEELKLRNVRLTEEMEFFVESEIVSSRLFSNDDDGRVPDFKNNLQKRMDWLLGNIECLKTAEEESKFLLLAKCITQNIHILKYQLKATYEKIPWEELEFCLVSYIGSIFYPQEKSIIPLIAINKETLLSQLGHFAALLKKLSKDDLACPNEYPVKIREEVVSKIKENSPEFMVLYEIYQKVRDMYSLEKLEEYLNLSLSVNHKEKHGQLAIIRVLQVLSDYVKNTLDNCKLSGALSRIILSDLPKETRNIVIDLRNSVSHVDSLRKRLKIEEKNSKFFRKAQNHLKQLLNAVSRILTNEKLIIAVDLLEKLTKTDNIAEVCELSKRIKLVQKCMDVENFKVFDEEKINGLINELETALSSAGMSGRELRLCNDVINNPDETPFSFALPLHLVEVFGSTALRCFDEFKSFDGKISAGEYALMKNVAMVALRGLSPTNYSKNMSKVRDFVKEIDKSIKRNSSSLNISKIDEEKLNRLLFEINFAAATKIEDVWCLDVGEDILDPVEGSKQSFLETEREKYLNSKRILLENLIGSNEKSAKFLKENKKLRLAAEVLLFDVLCISDDVECESDKLVVNVEDHSPILTGQYLRNYLAHGSAFLDIFSTDPATAILSNSLLFIKDEISIKCRENGKVVCYDLPEARKEKLDHFMNIVTNQDQLFLALEKGDMEKSLALIKSGSDVFGRSINDESSLHFAAKSQNIDVAKFAIDQKVGADMTDKKGRTALHVAAAHGNGALVEYLVVNRVNIDLEQKDKKGRTCLHLAAKHGDVKTVELLIEMGADLFLLTDQKPQPAFYSEVENDEMDLAAALALRGAHMFGCGIIGRLTPLHIAAANNNIDVIKLILKKGAQVDLTNDLETTPLIAAAENGCADAAKTLIKAGANVNAYYAEIFTPLHFAAIKGHMVVAKILLQNGAQVDPANHIDKPIQFAAMNGQVEMVKLLIKHRANIRRKNSWGCPSLHLATQFGHSKVIETLLGAGVDIHSKEERGLTALHLSTSNDCPEVTELLLKKGANTETKNDIGMTALHLALRLGNVKTVSLLLKFKCNVNAKGPNGITPLHSAATTGSCEMAELLLKNGAKVNATCQEGCTPLYAATKCRHLNMVQFLVKHGAKVNLGEITPATEAIEINSPEILEYLVKQGANEPNDLLLFQGIFSGFTECVRVLLENGFPANIWSDNRRGALHLAAAKGFKNIVCDLLDHGAKVNSVDKDKMTSLHYAVKLNFYEVVEVLLSRGANVHTKDIDGETPLHDAAEFADLRIMELLLAKGASPLVENKDRETPLSISMKVGDLEKVKALFQTKMVNTMTPMRLWGEHSVGLFHYFLIYSAVPNLVEPKVKPIHAACLTGKQDIVEYLLDLGVNVNETCRSKLTPLHCAALTDNLPLIKFLVSKGANVNLKDKMKNTPLIIARENGTIVKFLFENGAYFDERLKFDDDASKVYLDVVNLLKAVKKNDVSEVKKHIKMGTYLNAISSSSATPLHYASCKGYYEIGKVLLEHNANVNVSASKACTPLHYAAIYSHEDVVLELLSHGAVYNALTDGGSTPLSLATDGKIVELLSLIEKCFDLVEKGDVTVESIIQEEFVENKRRLEALMKTRNRNMQDIFEVADKHKYPKANNLYEICFADFIATNLRESRKTGIDEETLMNIKSELKKKQEWLIRKNTSSASSVLQQISNLLKDMEKNETAKLIRNANSSGKQGDVIVAALKGDLDDLKMAIQRGCSVNKTDSNGRIALHYAADRGDEKCVQLLLQSGADVSHVSHKGNTALHTAVNRQSAPIVTMLLEFALNNRKLDFINKPTLAKGNTALHVAAKNGNLDVLKILLKYGATYEIENLDGDKPRDLSSNVEIVQLFDLLSEMFADTETGNFRVVKRMKSMKKEDVSAVAGARNLGGRTILQVAIGHEHKNISSNLLKIIQAANAK